AGQRTGLEQFSPVLYTAIGVTLALVCAKIYLKNPREVSGEHETTEMGEAPGLEPRSASSTGKRGPDCLGNEGSEEGQPFKKSRHSKSHFHMKHDRGLSQAWYPFPSYAAVSTLVLFSCALPLFYQACMDGSISLGVETLLAASLAALVLITAYGAVSLPLARRLGISAPRLDNALATALCPLMLIPILIPLANELQFAMSGLVTASPRSVWLGLVGLALVGSVFLAARVIKAGPLCRTSRLVNDYYFPVLIAASAIFAYHSHFFTVGPAVDFFHWGELTVPVQQLSQFGRMPFVDLLPTHGLRDMVLQTAYTLLNGYRGLEMLIWSYGIDVLMAVLLYFLLSRITSRLFSFLFVLAVPWVTWIMLYGQDYCVLILPALVLVKAVERPGWSRMAMFWLVIVCAFWFRYDAGLLSMAAGSLLLLAFLQGRGWKDWWAAVTSGVVVMLGSLALFSVLAYSRNRSPLDLGYQLWLQLRILGSGQGFSEIWPAWNAVTFLMYCVLPAVCIAYIVTFLWERFLRARDVPRSWYILAFLAVVSLLLSFRNLHRHGLNEGYSALFGVFLMASVPVMLGLSKRTAEIAFVGVVLVHTMILGDYSWLNPATAEKLAVRHRRLLAEQKWSDTYFKTGKLFTFHQWRNKESRLKENNDWQYRGLTPFCDEYMNAAQTFYDFSNGTLLYLLADREVVSYLLQGQLHTGEQVQDFQIRRMRDKQRAGKLPFVIFKQGTGWDSLDGVPNELRSFRITEFIYSNYKPFGYVGGLQIWREKSLASSEGRRHALQKMTLPLLNRYALSNGKRIDTGTGVAFKAIGGDSRIFRFLDLTGIGPLDKEHYWFLRLLCRSSVPGTMTVHFMRPGKPAVIGLSRRSEMSPAYSDEWNEVVLPIPISGSGPVDVLADVVLTAPPDAVFEISSAELIAATDPLFPRISTITQQLDFKKLPLVWAKYDEGGAWQRTQTLGTLETRRACEPEKELLLDLGSAVDKSSGNYLQLRIRSEHSTEAAVCIPGRPESCIRFDLEAEPELQDYVIRISCLWDWMKDDQAKLVLRTKQPIWVEKAVLRKGD
ncbi:MAG: hypothetical protein HY912_22525, partial [Desulfomonile tiedjei]|nr:hypothetical protein [Desulfomonile tiedjei]